MRILPAIQLALLLAPTVASLRVANSALRAQSAPACVRSINPLMVDVSKGEPGYKRAKAKAALKKLNPFSGSKVESSVAEVSEMAEAPASESEAVAPKSETVVSKSETESAPAVDATVDATVDAREAREVNPTSAAAGVALILGAAYFAGNAPTQPSTSAPTLTTQAPAAIVQKSTRPAPTAKPKDILPKAATKAAPAEKTAPAETAAPSPKAATPKMAAPAKEAAPVKEAAPDAPLSPAKAKIEAAKAAQKAKAESFSR